jgi:hypothetical protein
MRRLLSFFAVLGMVTIIKASFHWRTSYAVPVAAAQGEDVAQAPDNGDERRQSVGPDGKVRVVDPREISRTYDSAPRATSYSRPSGVSFEPGKPMIDLGSSSTSTSRDR